MTHGQPPDQHDHDKGAYALHSHASINDFDEDAWNACAFGEAWQASSPYPNPFISHAFLKIMEKSGSVGAGTGWRPMPLSLTNEHHELVAVAPAYIKSHSQGEYVFDHAFADAYFRAGGNYYPKLQIASPFSPVTGPRLLAKDDSPQTRQLLASAITGLVDKLKLSSAHISFMTEQNWNEAAQAGWLQRLDQQFHFLNQGYDCFEDFLATLNARKRKELKRERREALSQDIEIEWLTGADITPEICDIFYEFYLDTSSRKWGAPYLTHAFFHGLRETMAEHTLFIMAKRHGDYIAGAFNMIGADTLFGRNWGAKIQVPFLHFEVCYYQAIDFALKNGLRKVEAGAQGGHKLARGYVPCPTYSAHYFPDQVFYKAVEDYLNHERSEVIYHMDALKNRTPFRKE